MPIKLILVILLAVLVFPHVQGHTRGRACDWLLHCRGACGSSGLPDFKKQEEQGQGRYEKIRRRSFAADIITNA